MISARMWCAFVIRTWREPCAVFGHKRSSPRRSGTRDRVHIRSRTRYLATRRTPVGATHGRVRSSRPSRASPSPQAAQKTLHARGADRTSAHLDQVQYPELALRAIDDEHEVERRIAAVHDAQLLAVSALWGLEERLELRGVEEVAEARGPRGHERVDLLDEGLLGLVDRGVELGQARYARSVDCRQMGDANAI